MIEIELVLRRKWLLPSCTIGTLHQPDNSRLCFILEDKVRSHKIPGKTAIPSGRYRIIRTMSQRFEKVLPVLLDVPQYTGIRIHSGITEHHTEGCLLPGVVAMIEHQRLARSREAFAKLDQKLEEWLRSQQVWITIINPVGAPEWKG